ncbi:MAG: DUF2127 domain-containing protein [Candidatus Acidiferrales bacterium]
MQSKSILHQSFEVGIALKGVGALFEIFVGVALWFVKPSGMNEIVRRVCENLLVDAPHNVIFSHVLNASQRLADKGTTFAAIYLFSHGVVKIALVISLWLNKIWAYPLTIMVFTAFMVYQVHRFTRTHSWALIALTVFDGVIIYLTWKEYQQQKAKRGTKIGTE